jgi:formylglycine-generating enzyme required for sulfatase activity
MHRHSFRVVAFATLSLGSLLSPLAGQASKQNAAAAAVVVDDTMGLPPFLLPVPPGTVEVGLTAEQFIDACCQAIFPSKPKIASTFAPEKFVTAMKRSASLLGRKKVQVDGFLLGKWPVTNGEYEQYVNVRRANKSEVRPPYHWWRFAREDDYKQRLEEINQLFPKEALGPIFYWERKGTELPYKVTDKDGKSIADLPVTYVNWREANEFAAWLGMRLPTEVELTRAMRGDGGNTWPLAEAYTEELLKQLQIFNARDQQLKPVGTVQQAYGPFGHWDMHGQVWQLVADRGYRPINGQDEFNNEWKRLQKDKAGQLMNASPSWRDDLVLAKGGSYLSWQEPVQLMIDTRAPVMPIDVLESMGFRLAKSMRPGYDLLFSMLRGGFSRSAFLERQEIDLPSQLGAERYELGPKGFPTSYAAVSFAPVTWLSTEKSTDLGKLLEKSQEFPLHIGALAVTTMVGEDVPAGIYSVLYRNEGQPRELSESVKQAHKAAVAAAKGKGNDDDKKAGWNQILARYGLTMEDCADKGCANGSIEFVRIDGVKLPTEVECFALQKEGRIVGVLRGTKRKPAIANQPVRTIAFAEKDGKNVATLEFSVVFSEHNNRKLVSFELPVPMAGEAPTAEKPWRMPQ